MIVGRVWSMVIARITGSAMVFTFSWTLCNHFTVSTCASIRNTWPPGYHHSKVIARITGSTMVFWSSWTLWNHFAVSTCTSIRNTEMIVGRVWSMVIARITGSAMVFTGSWTLCNHFTVITCASIRYTWCTTTIKVIARMITGTSMWTISICTSSITRTVIRCMVNFIIMSTTTGIVCPKWMRSIYSHARFETTSTRCTINPNKITCLICFTDSKTRIKTTQTIIRDTVSICTTCSSCYFACWMFIGVQ